MTLKVASLVTLGPEVMAFQQLAWQNVHCVWRQAQTHKSP